jgi:two-component system, NtrC family, response regulator AtoC
VKVLVVDDERSIREAVARYLGLEQIETASADNGLAAQRLLLEEPFAAAVVDVRMPGMNGLELLRWVRDEGPRLPVIMISAFGEVADAVEAMKLGAADYLVKPFDPDELVLRLRKAVETQDLRDRASRAQESEGADTDLAGNSAAIRRVRDIVARVAPTPTTVLITGESGTGKEVVARSVHRLSPRAEAPFVPVNTGGLPESLLESELFGFEKGAFTGAETRKPGLFEVAGSGTLFLDEIGDMPPSLQVKLLRVLQDRRLTHLGGTRPIPIDARIVAATNRNLEARVREGAFREDLYYRLNVVRIEMPPLRDRRDDIPEIAGVLVKRLARKLARPVPAFAPGALERLAEHPFPGNVRELENILERAMIFAPGTSLEARDLDLPAPPTRAAQPPPPPDTLAGIEKRAVEAALQRWQGNRTRAAEELGIGRRTLQNWIKQHGIE